jgi:hypothetical protein
MPNNEISDGVYGDVEIRRDRRVDVLISTANTADAKGEELSGGLLCVICVE